MALTLPYPSMSFVPLDVLTAEEMNRIVSNYTYIANQFPIATNNIANNAITPSKASFTKYSANETVIGTWIDGKSIYRKVIHITNPQTSNTDYGVISSNIQTVVDVYGVMIGSNGSKIPVPQTDSSSAYSVVFVQPDGALRGRFSFMGVAPSSVYVVVEYTKSTN